MVWEVVGYAQVEGPGLHWRALSTVPSGRESPVKLFSLFFFKSKLL